MSDYAHAVNQAHIGGYKQGKDEGRKELIRWLFEPCKEHFHLTFSGGNGTVKGSYIYKHHYLCPYCMEELKEFCNEAHANQKNIKEQI